MPLSRRVASCERLAELQADCMADDLPVANHMLSWTEEEAVYYFESGGQEPPAEQRVYPRVWLTSDVHTDRAENMAWLRSLPQHPGDAVVVAGDVSHQMEQLEATLRAFSERFAHVFFTAGNHDLWITRNDGGMDSLAKLDAIDRLCDRMGNVHSTPRLLRGDGSGAHKPGQGLWVVPLASWYDDSLDLTHFTPSLIHRAGDMRAFTWSDFALCKWPAALLRPSDTMTGHYPAGVACKLAERNEPSVREVNEALCGAVGDAVLSFSHFLPREQTLPDWLDPAGLSFSPGWVSHPAGGTAVNFSRVAGSRLIDEQLRRLTAGVQRPPDGVCHVHAFGHSHRPKDFSLDGVRYVSHPLGYSKERVKRLTPEVPHLKLVWDVDGAVPPPPQPLIRYWEEHGGREPELDALLASPARPPAERQRGAGSMRRNAQSWHCGTEASMQSSAIAAQASGPTRRGCGSAARLAAGCAAAGCAAARARRRAPAPVRGSCDCSGSGSASCSTSGGARRSLCHACSRRST